MNLNFNYKNKLYKYIEIDNFGVRIKICNKYRYLVIIEQKREIQKYIKNLM